jgi:lysophospholipase L1-like esterase
VPPTDVPGPVHVGAPDPATDGATDTEPPLLPVLNREALTARVAAQQALLGASGVLFEDGQGRPVPWIASADTPMGEVDLGNDILDELPGSSGLGGPSLGTTPGGTTSSMREAVNGNALGLYTPLEPEDGESRPLEPFYAALRDLARGSDPDGKVRVLAYGASHTDADVYPHYLRAYLQERFGNGGHGFVHVARPWRWYRHVDMSVEGDKYWVTEHAQRASGRQDGLYGLLGASLSTKNKRAFGRVSARHDAVGSHFEIYYLAQPKGGSFRVIADGERIAKVKTRADATAAGYHAFELPEGAHTIEIQPEGNGEVRLFGMTVERGEPGVVVDTLGIGGTRASNMLAWDEAVWGDNVRRRDPVILAYGTNEANDSDRSIGSYETDLREVIAKMRRVAPEAACMLVGPGDFPMPGGDGSWMPRPRLSEIIDVQRQVATDTGCAFWDARAFMGGELSMTRWAASDPPMAKADHIHLTKRGYVRMGMALVDAMMVAFDDPGA